MKEYAEVTREVDHWLMEPLLRGIGGQICRDNHWSTPKNVINVKGLHQAFISLGVLLTLYPVHGLLSSGG